MCVHALSLILGSCALTAQSWCWLALLSDAGVGRLPIIKPVECTCIEISHVARLPCRFVDRPGELRPATAPRAAAPSLLPPAAQEYLRQQAAQHGWSKHEDQ